MNSRTSRENLDPDTVCLFEALSIIESEDYCMKQFKNAFLKSSTEAKKEVRSSISSFIETLKEREDKLCQQIDEQVLQVVFFKENSRDSFLLESSPNCCEGERCSLPTLKMKFVNQSGNLEQNLQEFGSIQVEITNNPVVSEIRKRRLVECAASPMSIDTPRTSPESSTGSVESFDVISESDLSESPPKPVRKKSVRDLIHEAIERSLSMSYPEQLYDPECYRASAAGSYKPKIPQPPATALINQLKPYNNDPKPNPANHKPADSTTRNDQPPSPSSVIKEKFGEYLCGGEQDKWLASSYKM